MNLTKPRLSNFIEQVRRRICTSSILPLLLLLTLPVTVKAQDYTYTINNGEITIAGYSGSGGAVEIPDTISGLPVTSIGDFAFGIFGLCTSLTSVAIPDSVTNIGRNAFWGCTGLTNVTVGKSVTSVGDGAFVACINLAAITVEPLNSVYSSVDGVLFNKNQTTLIQYPGGKAGAYTIPNSVAYMGGYAFFDCFNLTGVTIGNGVTSIGDWAFASCTSLTSVTIPNSVTNIGDSAFNSCTALTNLTIGSSVTSIGLGAFQVCTHLTSVTLPSSVTSIGDAAFFGCTGLTAITVDAFNSVYSSVAGVLFDASRTTLIQFPAGKAGSYTIPDSVTSIGDDAFYLCTNLTSVTIPNSVTSSIGNYMFQNCYALTNVAIGNSVTSIGSYAFINCGLINVTIGTSVTSIGDDAFYLCTNLTSVTIPNSATNIGDSAFNGCTALTNVMIGSSVTNIGNRTFHLCTNLTSVTIPNSVVSIGDEAFYFCTALTNVTIGSSVTSIGEWAFGECTSLTNVTIPGSVTSIGNFAFFGCTGLTAITVDAFNSVYSSLAGVLFDASRTTLLQFPEGKAGSYTIPDSVTSIADHAFEICGGLTSVTIPSSVTSIGYLAFLDCTSLTAIMVDPLNSVYSSLAGVLFDNSQTTLLTYPCGKAGSYTIPSSVTSIGDDAFEGCANLTSVTIPNSVTNIGRDAFGGCTSLTNVTIPESVTSIGFFAFEYCPALTGVYFKGNPPSLDGSVFDNDNNATLYYLPGTIGWNPQVQTSDAAFGVLANGFGFTIVGTSGLSTVVEACTNLANPIWSPVGTNTLNSGSSYFSDPQWTNYPARFYRLGALMFGGLPAVLWNPQVQAIGVRTNQFGFTITGASNLVIVVEASMNLAHPTWSAVSTNTLTTGSAYFSDPQWANYPSRFYRLRSP